MYKMHYGEVAPFHLEHLEPSKVPRGSKIGTDVWKIILCSYTKFQVASILAKSYKGRWVFLN